MIPLERVSDTARWVAHYRAVESERADALFRDPYARALAGPRGASIAEKLPGGRAAAWGLVVRTRVFDEFVLGAIERGRVDTVLCLGAGLDTRPYRLALPPALRWIEVDLPEILAEKSAVLRGEQPVCSLESVALDLGDDAARRALFARAGAQARRALVVAEGLLVYLAEERVAALARDLHAQPGFAEWAIDLASPWYVERQRRAWGKSLAAANAPWRFAPEAGPEFFRPLGWAPVECRPVVLEARRLGREMRGAWLMHLAHRLGPARWREQALEAARYVRLARVGA